MALSSNQISSQKAPANERMSVIDRSMFRIGSEPDIGLNPILFYAVQYAYSMQHNVWPPLELKLFSSISNNALFSLLPVGDKIVGQTTPFKDNR